MAGQARDKKAAGGGRRAHISPPRDSDRRSRAGWIPKGTSSRKAYSSSSWSTLSPPRPTVQFHRQYPCAEVTSLLPIQRASGHCTRHVSNRPFVLSLGGGGTLPDRRIARKPGFGAAL